MISCIKGNVIELSAPSACIFTSSGIGYEVEFTLPDFCQLQSESEVHVWTHLVVREDAQLLYGFLEKNQREVFRQLIKINGVGAKMALAMLSNLSIAELMQCIHEHNEAVLVRIPGIGKKTAQRLLIELEDKLKHIDFSNDLLDTSPSSESAVQTEQQISSSYTAETKAALMSLGYKEKEADQAIKIAKKDYSDSIHNTQSLLKIALKQLAQ